MEEEVIEFSSTARNITADNIENMWEFAHEFFVEQDALEPGIEPGYFLTDHYATSPALRPGQEVKVHNPGFILVVGAGKEGISTPNMERVDYVALA